MATYSAHWNTARGHFIFLSGEFIQLNKHTYICIYIYVCFYSCNCIYICLQVTKVLLPLLPPWVNVQAHWMKTINCLAFQNKMVTLSSSTLQIHKLRDFMSEDMLCPSWVWERFPLELTFLCFSNFGMSTLVHQC